MTKIICITAAICLILSQKVFLQDTTRMGNHNITLLAGYHVGVVQIVFAYNEGEVKYLNQNSFYTVGFPIGITFNTHGKLKFDLEFVPFITPYINSDQPYSIHLLYHPGVLYPIGKGWTLGLRLAFEVGNNQFGFTPLLNKSFSIGKNTSFFIELVAPGRFGPEKSTGFTQLGGLHLGLGF